MEQETIVQAEPSPAAEMKVDPFESWQKTLVRETQPKTQEPAPADAPKAENTEEKSETAPETVAGKEQKEKRQGSKLSAEERIAQLVAKTKELEAKLRERETQTPKADSSPALAEPPKKLEAPQKPRLEDFKQADGNFDWQKYDEAKDKWVEEVADYNRKKAIEDFQTQQAEAERKRQSEEQQRSWTASEAKAREASASYDELTGPVKEAIGKLHPSRIEVITEYVVKHGGPEMLVHFAENPEDFNKVASAPDLMNIMRELTRVDVAIDRAAKEVKKAEKEPEPEKPSAPPETKASKPPSEVGGRATAAPDQLESATKNRDFRTFEQEMTRRYTARK